MTNQSDILIFARLAEMSGKSFNIYTGKTAQASPMAKRHPNIAGGFCS